MIKLVNKIVEKITTSSNWNKTDDTCSHCGQVTTKQKGLTKQNLRRLVVPKMDLNEIVFTVLLILILLLAYSYIQETKVCKDWISPMINNSGKDCFNVCSMRCQAIVSNSQEDLSESLPLWAYNQTNKTK
jgi:hypothetical protein